jgi:nitrate/TMAO reductase-like tetraheme cytochrome c subunit
VALTNTFVNYTSTDSFCGTTCHSMTWAAATYKRSPHFDNRFGVRATCGDCHIPYDANHPTPMQYIRLLLFKADRGAKDVWGELTKRMRTEEEWEKRRPQLAATVAHFLKTHDSITCRGCHTLEAFSGPRNAMTQLVHQDVIQADTVDCLECHAGVGHVDDGAAKSSGGWYTPQQAANGALIYARACAMCHGAGLHDAGAPALIGQPFWQAYGGQRVSTLWSAVHTQMPMAAPGSVSVRDSIDIMAFLLQQNGVAAGATPLDDSVDLTHVRLPQ